MWRRLLTLGASFDGAALRPFDANAVLAEPWPALRRWCLAGLSGTGLAVGFHASADLDAATRRAAAVALDLDGTRLLQACPNAMARLRLKLAVKLRDAMVWHARGPLDVWDCGWVSADAGARQALRQFKPRRPTFVVLSLVAPAHISVTLGDLKARSPSFAHPLRVLVLGRADASAPGGAVHIPA